MSLTQYQNNPGNVAIVMSSAIAETHVITFAAGSGYTINSGGTLTFTVANQATPQNLNITPTQLGTINIPYTITSAYTQEIKSGQITIVVLTGIPGFSWESEVLGSSSHQYRIASLDITSISHPMYGQTFTLARAAGQTTGMGPIGQILDPSGNLVGSVNFDGGTPSVTVTINAVGVWKVRMGTSISIHDNTFMSTYSVAVTASIQPTPLVQSLRRAYALRPAATELTGSGAKSISSSLFTSVFGCALDTGAHVAYLAVFGSGSIVSQSLAVGATDITGNVNVTLGAGANWRIYLNKTSNTPLQTNQFVLQPLSYVSDAAVSNLGDFAGYIVRCQN